MYVEEVLRRCMSMKAAGQGSEMVVQAVSVRESTAPPIRKWVLWKETSPWSWPAMLTSTRIVPGRTSATVKSMSVNSARPTSPGLPTWIRGFGLLASAKAFPEAVMVDQTWPTIRVPGGM